VTITVGLAALPENTTVVMCGPAGSVVVARGSVVVVRGDRWIVVAVGSVVTTLPPGTVTGGTETCDGLVTGTVCPGVVDATVVVAAPRPGVVLLVAIPPSPGRAVVLVELDGSAVTSTCGCVDA